MGNTHAKKQACQCKLLKEEIDIYKNLCQEMTEMISEKSKIEKELRKEITQLRESLEIMTVKNQDLERSNSI
jgi:hypothetical protein